MTYYETSIFFQVAETGFHREIPEYYNKQKENKFTNNAVFCYIEHTIWLIP